MRRQAHQDVDDAEDHLRQTLEHVGHRLGLRSRVESAKPMSTDNEDHAEDAAAGERADHGGWNNLQEEIGHRLSLRLTGVASHGACIARRRRRIEPGARLHERAHQEADDQRDAGEDFKVEGAPCRRRGRPS